MQKHWNFEGLSWIFIFLLCALVMAPIYFKCHEHFHFYTRNIVAIVIFFAFSKYIFLLPFTPFGRLNWWRLVMIFLPIPLLFYSLDTLFNFQRFVDEEGTIAFFKGSTNLADYNFGKYIRFEFVFFAVGALVTIVLLPVRMIISFWRTVNTKDKM
jgi:hypothetical protein